MKFLKEIIRKSFFLFGYEIHRTSGDSVSLRNFANLAQAYEQHLNETGKIVAKDDTRIKLLARMQGTPPSEAYFIVAALAKLKEVSGDVCEFGVAQGETSALIANEIRTSNKILHLFDSFEGLSKPSENDLLKDDIFSLGSMKAYEGSMSFPVEMVCDRLKAISFHEQRFVIHSGFIDQVINHDKNLPKAVSFAYVDFDLYEPIRLTLAFLHKITSNGAIIIIDDYDYFSTGVKKAVDDFLDEKNQRALLYECVVPNTQYGNFAILTKTADKNHV